MALPEISQNFPQTASFTYEDDFRTTLVIYFLVHNVFQDH